MLLLVTKEKVHFVNKNIFLVRYFLTTGSQIWKIHIILKASLSSNQKWLIRSWKCIVWSAGALRTEKCQIRHAVLVILKSNTLSAHQCTVAYSNSTYENLQVASWLNRYIYSIVWIAQKLIFCIWMTSFILSLLFILSLQLTFWTAK